MKRIIFTLITLISIVGSDLMSQSIEVYFEIIPEHILIQIEPNRRKDMVDLFKSGMPALARTRLGGTAQITDLTDKYIKIKMSDLSSVEMALIGDSSNHIAVIRTVCALACDSEIEFYTTTWEPTSNMSISKPVLDQFLTIATDNKPQLDQHIYETGRNIRNREVSISSEDRNSHNPNKELQVTTNNSTEPTESPTVKKTSTIDIRSIIDFVPVKYEFVTDEIKNIRKIKASNSLEQMLSAEDYEAVKPNLVQSVILDIKEDI